MEKKTGIRISSIFKARCPACHEGPVLRHVFGIHRRCQVCGHDFHPEPGFYMGAIAISYLLSAMLIIPPMIVLKILNVDIVVLLAFPFVEYFFVGSFLLVYSRVCWLHLDYRMTTRLQGSYEAHIAPRATELKA
jgi:uncharacterized protein (DUF983 family)